MQSLFKWIEGELRWRWGIVIAIGYAFCYVALRPLATDQWYLPAGLRVAALLLIPVRYWPYLIAGDITALIYSRYSFADEFGLLWLLVASAVLMPGVAGVVYLHRKMLVQDRLYGFLSVAVFAAITASLFNITTNYLFVDQSYEPVTWERAARYAVGHYLGIWTLAPIALMLKFPITDRSSVHALKWQACLALAAIGILCALVLQFPNLSVEKQHSLRLLTILPAAALTFLHGWRGAAIGIAGANLAIALTMQRENVPGTTDPVTYLSQQFLAVLAPVLFGLGVVISRHLQKANLNRLAEERAKKAEEHAKAMARSSYVASERELQRRAESIVKLGEQVKKTFDNAAEELLEQGQHKVALKFRNAGVLRAREIQDELTLLYPIEIQSVGLYEALSSGLIAKVWAQEGHVDRSLRGKADGFSFDLQLAAYRIICDIVSLLQRTGHPHLSLQVRSGKRRGHCGILIRVAIAGGDDAGIHPSTPIIDNTYIAGRVLAYGGLVHRRSHHISVLMSEPLEGAAKARVAH